MSSSKTPHASFKPPITDRPRLLNTLIDQGCEFPEAVDKTLETLAVNRDELVAAYDSQPT